MARPQKTIDLQVLENLATLSVTQREAAAFLKVNTDTLQRRLKQKAYRDAWDRGVAARSVGLRRMQWEAAKKGNVNMLIWLGKQELGQREVVYEEVTRHDDDQALQLFLDRVDSIAARLEEAGVTGTLDLKAGIQATLQMENLGAPRAVTAAGELAGLADPDRARLGQNADGGADGPAVGGSGSA